MLAVDNCYFPFHLTKSLIFNYLSVPPQTLTEAFDAFSLSPQKRLKSKLLSWELLDKFSVLFFADLLLITSERKRSGPLADWWPLCLWLRCIIEYQLVSERINEGFKLSAAKKINLILLCPSLHAFDNGVDTLLWVRSWHFLGAWFIAENYYKKRNWNRKKKRFRTQQIPFFRHFFSAQWNNRTKGGKCFSFHC